MVVKSDMSIGDGIMFAVNFVFGEKMDANELCLWDIAEATSRIKLISVYIIQGLI